MSSTMDALYEHSGAQHAREGRERAGDHPAYLEGYARAEAELTARARRVAELAILERHDTIRGVLGHDYSRARRRGEVIALERGLDALDLWRALESFARGIAERAGVKGVEPVPAAELREAYDRLATPRVERLKREAAQYRTPARERSLEAWRRVGAELAFLEDLATR